MNAGRRTFRAETSTVILVAAGAVMLALLVYVGRWLLFWREEWDFIVHRPDPTSEALLAPFIDNFNAAPVLLNDALLAAFGLRSYWPYLAVEWAGHFVAVALLYRIVSRRSLVLGRVAALSLLFLGSGWEVLLHPFQIQYLLAIIGGLLALDRLDVQVPNRERSLAAAAALVVAVLSSPIGVIFCGLLLVWGALRRHRATVVAVIPAVVVYAAWYVTWGRQGEGFPGPDLAPLDRAYAVLYGMGAAVAGLVGLPPTDFALAGLALGLGTLTIVAVLVWRGYRPEPLALAALAALATEHVLWTLFRASFGAEYGARSGYVYLGVIFLWLAIGVVRLPARRWVPLTAGILVGVMAVGNMRQFVGAARESRILRATAMAELHWIESMRADPRLVRDVRIDPNNLYTLTVGGYLEALDRFGRPSLDYDWEPYIDHAAFDVVRARLLQTP